MSKTITFLDKLIKLLNKLDSDWYSNEEIEKVYFQIKNWIRTYKDSLELKRFSMLSQLETMIRYNYLIARQIVFYYTNTKFYDVYKHTSPNGKVYIGITCQEDDFRWNDGEGYEKNALFYADIKKFGWNNINHELLYQNLDVNTACQYENELKRIAEQKMALRQQLEIAESRAEASNPTNAQLQRIKELFADEDNFSVYDDKIVRVLVECIRVMEDRPRKKRVSVA